MSKPKKKPKSECRFAPACECVLARWNDNVGGWDMPAIDACTPCRLQAVLDKMK